MDSYSFRIDRRPAHMGGGWRLQLLQNGVEVDSRVFPATTDDKQGGKSAYVAALRAAQTWVAVHSREP